ncbi:hypothetical protein FCV25MIE_25630 [Fagus crenata]
MSASKSRSHAMQLKEELTLIMKENRSIQEYMHTIKALADEIALTDHPISEDDLTLYILNGLGPDFREIATPSAQGNTRYPLRNFMICFSSLLQPTSQTAGPFPPLWVAVMAPKALTSLVKGAHPNLMVLWPKPGTMEAHRTTKSPIKPMASTGINPNVNYVIN